MQVQVVVTYVTLTYTCITALACPKVHVGWQWCMNVLD